MLYRLYYTVEKIAQTFFDIDIKVYIKMDICRSLFVFLYVVYGIVCQKLLFFSLIMPYSLLSSFVLYITAAQ